MRQRERARSETLAGSEGDDGWKALASFALRDGTEGRLHWPWESDYERDMDMLKAGGSAYVWDVRDRMGG